MARSGLDRIFRILVHVRTFDHPDAGTDGAVYLICAGREFNLNLAGEVDRRPGRTDHYRLGNVPEPSPDSPNVENPWWNNPRGIVIQKFWDHPVGLRFAPQPGMDPPDRWLLQHCWMSVFTVDGYEDAAYLGGEVLDPPDVLGYEAGLTIWLEKEVQAEDKAPLQHRQEAESRGTEFQGEIPQLSPTYR
jgi:hypothetical protein